MNDRNRTGFNLEAALYQLRLNYLESLSFRLQEIEMELGFLPDDVDGRALDRLYSIVRKIHGSATTLGFQRIGELCQVWENEMKYLSIALKNGIKSNLVEKMYGYSHKFRQLLENDAESSMKLVSNSPENGFLRVAVVDDDEDMRMLWSSILQEVGLEVQEAFNGLEGLKLIRDQKPHVVLLDLMMPVMTGEELCEAVRKDPDLKNIPIIIVSSLNDHKTKATCFRLGADEFLVKPVDPEELVFRIQGVIQNRFQKSAAAS